jgi:DeoR/GlpR family transcriptional regulator of sugar metabolism
MSVLEDETLEKLYQRILRENGDDIHVQDLVDYMGSSSATIRRQLSDLETRQLVVRTYGGVRAITSLQWLMRSFEERVVTNQDEKRALAGAAAKLIRPSMRIAMDGGTTTWMLARHIAQNMRDIDLTVVTNSMVIVQELARTQSIDLIMIGGRFRKESLDFVGPAALDQLAQMRFELAFIGCDGVLPAKGVYGLTEDGSAISAALVAHSDATVLLADVSKVGAFGGHQVAPMDAINVWFTGVIDVERTRGLPSRTRCIRVDPSDNGAAINQ